MTPDKFIQELERYHSEITAILGRFNGSFINKEDTPRIRTLVVEIIDLLDDTLGQNQYSSSIKQIFLKGHTNIYRTQSYNSVEAIIATLAPIITRLKRNPELCKLKEDVILGNKQIEYPDKITMKWLWHNVPYSFWFWIISVLITVFLAGVFVGQTKLYHDLITKNEDSTNLTKSTAQVPIAKDNNSDNTAAPIKNIP